MRPVYCGPEHVYRFTDTNEPCGPSVTTVLSNFVKVTFGAGTFYVDQSGNVISDEVMAAAADFGRGIHLAAFYLLSGRGLNYESLDPALVAPVQQFEAWLKYHGEARDGIFETPLYSEKLKVAGTPDLIYPSKRETIVCDFKTGAPRKSDGPQLAAYEALYREAHGLRANHKILRYNLYLPKDGSRAKFAKQDSPLDLHYFKSRLFSYSFERR